MHSATADRTVVGVFRNVDEARAAIHRLRNAGIPAADISLITGSASAGELSPDDITADVAADAGIGAGLGAIGGLLLGFTALVIPGIGPVMAAGPLLAALGGAGVGALAGGLVGALNEAGVPEHEAKDYGEHVRQGHVLVTIRAAGTAADRIRDILDHGGAIEAAPDEKSGPIRLEGPDPSTSDLRTDDEIVPPADSTAVNADVIGHNPGGEAMSADEARRKEAHYGPQNDGQRTWPHKEAFDIEDSLVRPEVVESENDPVAEAQRSSPALTRARIFQNARRR